MTSPKQRLANRANALHSTGPRTLEGKCKVSLNSVKHNLSIPIDEQLFAYEIGAVSRLIRLDCDNDDQAFEIAKRIVDFERNEAFLFSLSDDAEQREIAAFANNPYRKQLEDLANTHRNKKPAFLIFTTKSHKLKSKERTQEIKFLEGFLKLEENALLGKLREIKATKLSTLRYQKRAINQLIKSLRALGEIA